MCASLLQQRATKILVDTGGNASQAMIKAGYSKITAKNPSKLTKSDGFKEEIQKYKSDDLNEDLIKKSLVEDIKGKPKRRVGELKLAAEILKMKDTDGTTNISIEDLIILNLKKRGGLNDNNQQPENRIEGNNPAD